MTTVEKYRITWDRKLLRRWTEEFVHTVSTNPPAHLAYLLGSLRLSLRDHDPSCAPFIYMRWAIEQAQEELVTECIKALNAGKGYKFTPKDIKARTFDVLQDQDWLKAKGIV